MLRNITVIYSGDKCFPRKQKWHWMWRFSNCVWTNTNIKQEHSTESRSTLNVRIIQNKISNAQKGIYFFHLIMVVLWKSSYIRSPSIRRVSKLMFARKNFWPIKRLPSKHQFEMPSQWSGKSFSKKSFFLECNGLDTDRKMETFGLKTTWNRFEQRISV